MSGPLRPLLLVLGLVAACGGGTAEREPVGTSQPTRSPTPVELTVRRPDGSLMYVGDLRGRPTLLFLFATFDGASQAALQPVGRFARHNPDVHVVGIAVQPNPAPLLDAWVHALAPPFPLGYEPEERIAEGTSALGRVEAVPTFIMLDARGVEASRHTGFASERKLERMLREARKRAPDAPAGAQPPLLGQ